MSNNLRFEWRKPSTLTPNPQNWRKHPTKQRAAFNATFNEVGWAGALLYNEKTGKLIDGHLRREETIATDEPVPVLIGSWDEGQEALILATLDPLAAMAETDNGILDALLHQVESDSPEINAMLSKMAEDNGLYFEANGGGLGGKPTIEEDEPPIDKAEELQKKWQVQLGDLWLLGRHRLICGDCTDETTVARLFDGAKADLVFADPPYDIENQNYAGTIDTVCENSHIFVMHDDKGIVDYLRETKLNFHGFFVSTFGFFSPRGNDPYLAHILISHEKKGKPIPHRIKHDGFSTIVKMEYRGNLKDDETPHKHQKEIGFVSKFIEHYSEDTMLVYDPFLGSGTTIIAAHQLNRICYGSELSPKYCAVILERYASLTGETPQLAK